MDIVKKLRRCAMHIIGKIKKSKTEQIRVTIQSYEGGPEKIDIRNFFKTEDGEWKPTKKGVRIEFDEARPLRKLLKNAENSKDKSGGK